MLSSRFIRSLQTQSHRIWPMAYRSCSNLIIVVKPNSIISNVRYSGIASRPRNSRGIQIQFPLHKTVTAKVPTFGESISEGDVKFTCKVGDTFQADDVVMEIETDKTSVPVPAPVTGKIVALLVSDGDSVKPGQELFKMEASAVSASAKPAAQAKAPAAAEPKAAAVAAPKPKVKSKPMPGNELVGERKVLRVPMSPVRQGIVATMKELTRVNALLTTMNEINMGVALKFRQERKAAFLTKYGCKLTMLSIYLKSVANALQGQPVLNAVIEGKEVVYRDYCDIKIGLATPRGIIQPVIRNVESKNLVDIETDITLLLRREAQGKLLPEHLTGGTFTISNTGVVASLLETPMISPSQGAVIAVHMIKERPIAVKKEVFITPMMYVSLTYDHRLIDGREAVLFVRKVKSCLEDEKVLKAALPK